MPDGWKCENCNEFFMDIGLQTKITVSIEPRDYEAEVTLCSLKCFDEMRFELDDVEAYASEHRVLPSDGSR